MGTERLDFNAVIEKMAAMSRVNTAGVYYFESTDIMEKLPELFYQKNEKWYYKDGREVVKTQKVTEGYYYTFAVDCPIVKIDLEIEKKLLKK